MIVLDASAVVELLLGTATGAGIASRIADPAIGLHVPHLVDVVVTRALRRLVRLRAISSAAAAAALKDLSQLDLQRHSHEPLLARVWQLRDNLTAYAAAYVSLAEVLDATLITCDSRLAKIRGTRARVELIRALE